MNTMGQTKDQLGIGVSVGSLTPVILAGNVTQIPANRLHFIMVTDGKGIVKVDERDYTVQQGTFIYVLPHHLLMLRSCSDDFKTVYVCFTFELLSDFPLLLKAELSDYVGHHPCLDLDDMDCVVLAKYYNLLIDRYLCEDTGMEIIKGVLFSFVMEVNRIYSGRNDGVQVSHQDKLTDGFFKLLHIHFCKEHSVAFYAQELCVSDKHLMRVIKKKNRADVSFLAHGFPSPASQIVVAFHGHECNSNSRKPSFFRFVSLCQVFPERYGAVAA